MLKSFINLMLVRSMDFLDSFLISSYCVAEFVLLFGVAVESFMVTTLFLTFLGERI